MLKNRIELFRHGESKYRQEIVSWSEASDLTENGRRVVENNAIEMAKENVGIRTKVAIFSSPFGRTLETSLIIVRELNKFGIETENENDAPVLVRRSLQEQINFSNVTMNLLALGGEWDGTTGKTFIDSRRTNPKEKVTSRYFLEDALNMNHDAWEELPLDLKNKILAMETSDLIQGRIYRFVSSLGRKSLERDLSVVVTHDALLALLLEKAQSEITWVNPGERVSTEVVNGELVIRKVAGIDLNKELPLN